MGRENWMGNDDEETFGQDESGEQEAPKAVEPAFDLDAQESVGEDEIDYDNPVPKGVGGSFITKNGQRYRKRPS
jgi:hypothetical protein